MHCPRCHTAELVEKDRTGVQIDICTSCRGVWLDRGELEKLIAMARDEGGPRDDDDDRRRGRRDDDDDDDDRGRGGRRRWWDIFD
jgi:Zn-finger nucleic acid-binding protein